MESEKLDNELKETFERIGKALLHGYLSITDHYAKDVFDSEFCAICGKPLFYFQEDHKLFTMNDSLQINYAGLDGDDFYKSNSYYFQQRYCGSDCFVEGVKQFLVLLVNREINKEKKMKNEDISANSKNNVDFVQ